MALDDAAQRLLARSEMRAAGVVLEAGEDAPPAVVVEVDLDRDVADQARLVGADRLEVDESEPRDLLVRERVAVTEQLIAAADPEHDRAAPGRGMQRIALGLHEIQGAEPLVAVLAAAEVEQVVRAGVDARRRSSPRSP